MVAKVTKRAGGRSGGVQIFRRILVSQIARDKAIATLAIGLDGPVRLGEREVTVEGVDNVIDAQRYGGLVLWHLGRCIQRGRRRWGNEGLRQPC